MGFSVLLQHGGRNARGDTVSSACFSQSRLGPLKRRLLPQSSAGDFGPTVKLAELERTVDANVDVFIACRIVFFPSFMRQRRKARELLSLAEASPCLCATVGPDHLRF